VAVFRLIIRESRRLEERFSARPPDM